MNKLLYILIGVVLLVTLTYVTATANKQLVTTVSEDGEGNDMESWNHRIFYDDIYDIWHLIYIDSTGYIRGAFSLDDGKTWSVGNNIAVGSYDYEDLDCVMGGGNSTNNFIHCAYSNIDNRFVYYQRLVLTNSTPFYFNLGGQETCFDAYNQGQESVDDAESPKIILDSNNCSVIVFGLEDNSEALDEEHEVVLIRENISSGCNDGDWDYNEDTDAGFPIYSIQEGTGYPSSPKKLITGLASFGDLDAQIFWINNSLDGTYTLETIFFNGTLNTTYTQTQLDGDIEAIFGGVYTNYVSFFSLIIDETQITFGMDDGTTDLDAYIIEGKNGSSVTQIDTGLDMIASASQSGSVTAVVDNSSGNGTIWLFAVDDDDPQDIYYATSNDKGLTWQNQTLWEDEGSANEVKYLSAYFNEETCDIMVTWVGGSSSPFNITIDRVNPCFDILQPTITVNTPLNTTYKDINITFNLTVIDDVEVDTCLYTLNNGTTNYTMTNISDEYTATNSTMSEGSHTVIFYCNDTSNNLNDEENVTFFIDSILPTINITHPQNITYSAHQTELNYTYVEVNCNSVWYSTNNSYNSTPTTCGTNFTITSISGENNWTVYMNDTLNNQNSTMVTFIVTIPSEEAGAGGDSSDVIFSPLFNKIREKLNYLAFIGGFVFLLMCGLILYYVKKNMKKKKK